MTAREALAYIEEHKERPTFGDAKLIEAKGVVDLLDEVMRYCASPTRLRLACLCCWSVGKGKADCKRCYGTGYEQTWYESDAKDLKTMLDILAGDPC